jgi:hypothetical protein
MTLGFGVALALMSDCGFGAFSSCCLAAVGLAALFSDLELGVADPSDFSASFVRATLVAPVAVEANGFAPRRLPTIRLAGTGAAAREGGSTEGTSAVVFGSTSLTEVPYVLVTCGGDEIVFSGSLTGELEAELASSACEGAFEESFAGGLNAAGVFDSVAL